MIIRAEDRKQILTPNARGGDGTLDKRDYVLENMPENAKMFAEIKLEPGCSLGTHPHTSSMRARSRSTTTAPSAKCTQATSPSAMTARATALPTARTSPRRCSRPSSRPSKETP